MKQTLLSIAALIFCCFLNAQVAYQAPGVFECAEDPADPHLMTPFVLGNQNPALYTVTYHMSVADATANTNAIATTINYFGTQIIYVIARVTDNSTGSFAISSFKTVWNLPWLYEQFPDIFACMSAQLPFVEVGAFYSLPDGQGIQYEPASPIDVWNMQSQQLYYYAGNQDCHIESTFFVFLDYPPTILNPVLTNCIGDESFDLTQSLSFGIATYYHSFDDASQMIGAITDPTNYPGAQGEMIWVELQGAICSSIEPITLGFQACTPNTIYGKVRLTQNTSCVVENPGFAGCEMTRTFGSDVKQSYTNADGNYLFTNVPVGSNTVVPLPSESYMTVLNPTSVTLNTYMNSQLTADFCVKENPFNDIRTFIWPLGTFRPAVTSDVRIYLENHGNTAASGTTTFTYDATKVNFVSASVSPASNSLGTLTFSYSIAAHSAQGVTLSFATPTTTVAGDILAFSATAAFVADENQSNNSASMQEVVVNSFDPNDITVVEGPMISLAQAEKPLHYIVRFQNTGTADALQVRIENPLDGLLDASTFRPLYASHTFFTERSGSDVSFFFPNINLPAEQDDEPASHGFIVYEIKPVSSAAVGDVIDNQASIFFDTNDPIVTNVATTTISQLAVNENALQDLTIYPNPAFGKVSIHAEDVEDLEVEITDVRGVRVLSKSVVMTGEDAILDISNLNSGVYFVKVRAADLSTVRKLVIK